MDTAIRFIVTEFNMTHFLYEDENILTEGKRYAHNVSSHRQRPFLQFSRYYITNLPVQV